MVVLSPDEVIFWQWGFVTINETIVFTWLVMALLVIFGWLSARHLSMDPPLSRSQNLFETLITYMQSQIREIAQMSPDRYLPFSGTLFLFISVANLLDIIPGYRTPTSSLSTTAALMRLPNLGVYSSSKRALAGLSLTAREELKKDNIVVGVVYPYITLTNFGKNTIKDPQGEDRQPGNSPTPADTAEYIAQKILEGIENGDAEIFAHDWMKKMAERDA